MTAASDAKTIGFRIRWALPMVGPPIDDAWMQVSGTRIVDLQPYHGQPFDREFPEAAAVPRGYNAHSHLELSHEANLQPAPGESFSVWLAKVIALRQQQRREGTTDAHAALVAAWNDGAADVVQTGTAWVGDIVSPNIFPLPAPLPTLHGTWFVELIGWTPQRVDAAHDTLRQLRNVSRHLASNWNLGLSPHSPYSVAPELFQAVCDAASQHGRPVAMHLAESPEEAELMQSHAGPLVDVLAAAGAWDSSDPTRPKRLEYYLSGLATAPRALVVHGNYLARPSWEFLARHRDRMAVVYCPRTHAAFGHRRYPLKAMLDSGVRVLLGTDSLATNPDLNIWEEVRACRRFHPEIDPATIVRMVTTEAWEWAGVANSMDPYPQRLDDWCVLRIARDDDPYSFGERIDFPPSWNAPAFR